MRQERKVGYVVLIFLFVLMMGGCVSFPKLTYLSPSDEDAEGAIKFYLQGSMVTLGIPSGENAEGIKTETTPVGSLQEFKDKGVCAVVTPAESKNHFYALKPHQSIWSKTSVSVSYRDNTRLIKTIGTDFKDNRIEVIGKVAAIVATGISILKTTREPLRLPVVIDLSNINEGSITPWRNIPGHHKWWYKLALDTPPEDSVKATKYFVTPRASRALAYSACQEATLFVVYSEGTPSEVPEERAVFNTRIANPNYVCTLNLPAKGSITMHSICGADIRPEEYTDVSGLDILEAVMKQVEMIKQAQDKGGEK